MPQAALDLIARVVLNPRQVAWVENPGYEGATAAFGAAVARVVGMDPDQQGLMLGADEPAAAENEIDAASGLISGVLREEARNKP